MKFLVLLFLFVISLSCQSNLTYSGTTGSRYGIDPFPTMKEWVEYTNNVNITNKSKDSILWIVGSYIPDGVKMSFEGKDSSSKNIYFSEFDFNEKYLSYFDDSKIDVFLLLEPGKSLIPSSISYILEKYKSHKSIVGICIDLEWLDPNNEYMITKSNIEKWIEVIKTFDPKYKLILKHWNTNNIEHYFNEDIIYVQSMEGINNEQELRNRHALWSRKFYPSPIGFEFGFIEDKEYWSRYDNPITDIYNLLIGENTTGEFSYFWNESSLLDVTTGNN
ncbi:MAG: hypothetical protein OCD02_20935 [Spirochaetaceae bacterium]